MHRQMRTAGLGITEVRATFGRDEDPVPFMIRYLDWGYRIERALSSMTVFAKGRGRVVVIGGNGGDLDDAQRAIYERDTDPFLDAFFAPVEGEGHLGNELAATVAADARTA